MKKLYSIVFIALCLAMCAVLSVGYGVKGPSAACANEVPAPKPVLMDGGKLNDSYLSQLADYYSGRFFLRRELITAYAGGQTGLFGTYISDDVVSGKKGWLYYKSTLGDYRNDEGMTERELYAAANNLALMQEYCESQGADFVFMAAPNKNTIYPQNMPFAGTPAGTHDLDRLYALLDGMGVRTVDIAARFREESEVLYYAHDSHWTGRGAALGADLINEAFGRESDYFSGDFTRSQSHTGDLYEMLYPAGSDTELDFTYGDGLNFDYAKNSGTRPDSITIRTSGSGEGSLAAYRDSFGNSLYPYLADSFGKAYFSRSAVYDLTVIAGEEADAVLIELVERNLPYLVQNVPVFPAPVRENAFPGLEGTIEISVSDGSKAMEGYVLVTGKAEADAESPVYLVADGCAYQCTLTENDGFAAYVPADAAISGVAYAVDGSYVVNAVIG